MATPMPLLRVRWTATEDRDVLGTIPTRITDDQGREMRSLHPPSHPWEIRPGVDVRSVGDAHLRVNSRIRLTDLLHYPYFRSLTLSVRALAALEAAGMRIDDGCYRWRLHVLDQRGRHRDEFVILWPLEWRELVDLERSQVEYFPGTKVPREIRRWFLPAVPPDFDLFATAYFVWLATPAVQKAVLGAGLTGFGFEPIDYEVAKKGAQA